MSDDAWDALEQDCAALTILPERLRSVIAGEGREPLSALSPDGRREPRQRAEVKAAVGVALYKAACRHCSEAAVEDRVRRAYTEALSASESYRA